MRSFGLLSRYAANAMQPQTLVAQTRRAVKQHLLHTHTQKDLEKIYTGSHSLKIQCGRYYKNVVGATLVVAKVCIA
jgi:hypothetical protein